MRVLFLSNGFPPHRWAGTEHHTAALAKELAGRGDEVRVVCAGDWDTGRAPYNGFTDAVDEGIPVRRLHLNWTKPADPFRSLYDNDAVAKVLDGYLDEWRPDVVHVMSCETLSASVLAVAKARALRTVLSLTDFWFLCPRITLLRTDGENCDGHATPGDCLVCLSRSSRAYRWPRLLLPDRAVGRLLHLVGRVPALSRRRGLRGMVGDMAARQRFLSDAIRWPDVRVTASPFVRRMHESNGVDAPIRIAPYGHDLSWLRAPVYRAPSPVVRLGYVGQLVPSKGVHVLLEAVRRLPAPLRSRVALRVYGDPDKVPSYGAELRALSAGLPDVAFCGTYRHDDSAAVYASFDVMVVPSLWYDFPLVIHEAFATGAPVIATRLGGMAEAVVHDGNGLLVDKGDVEGLARCLARLVEEPDLLPRLRAGISPVKSIADEVDEMRTCYEARA